MPTANDELTTIQLTVRTKRVRFFEAKLADETQADSIRKHTNAYGYMKHSHTQHTHTWKKDQKRGRVPLSRHPLSSQNSFSAMQRVFDSLNPEWQAVHTEERSHSLQPSPQSFMVLCGMAK